MSSPGRHAFIGMGFTERNEAFDFSSALQDHAKLSLVLLLISSFFIITHLLIIILIICFRYLKQRKEMEENARKAASRPKVDYSLPEGAKIHVELKVIVILILTIIMNVHLCH